MNDNQPPPAFHRAPTEYDQAFFAAVIRRLESYLARITSVGPVRASTLNLSDLPTSDSDLRQGDVWNDGGTLKIKE